MTYRICFSVRIRWFHCRHWGFGKRGYMCFIAGWESEVTGYWAGKIKVMKHANSNILPPLTTWTGQVPLKWHKRVTYPSWLRHVKEITSLYSSHSFLGSAEGWRRCPRQGWWESDLWSPSALPWLPSHLRSRQISSPPSHHSHRSKHGKCQIKDTLFNKLVKNSLLTFIPFDFHIKINKYRSWIC